MLDFKTSAPNSVPGILHAPCHLVSIIILRGQNCSGCITENVLAQVHTINPFIAWHSNPHHLTPSSFVCFLSEQAIERATSQRNVFKSVFNAEVLYSFKKVKQFVTLKN